MTMNEPTEGSDLKEMIIISLIGIVVLTYLFFSMGVISLPEKAPPAPVSYVNITEPEPTITWTPEPTPEALPTLKDDYVDPFAPGPRSEGQWYKWYRADVQGLKDMQIGVIAYRHAFMDRYTWYSPSTGNYFTQKPQIGNRFFVVWVHVEEFGTDTSEDSSYWPPDESKFGVQVKDTIYPAAINGSYLPVIRIKEFDELTNYYKTITAPPFGYFIRYTGTNPESGGFAAEKIAPIRMGRENGVDGYIIYEVPRESQLRDMQLVGDFGTFGSAQWKY